MKFIQIFMEKYLLYDTINDFSVWSRTGSNPADINRFGSYTVKIIIKISINACRSMY